MNTVLDIISQQKNNIALISEFETVTYNELLSRAKTMSSQLLMQGICKHSKVMYVGENSIEFFVLFFALKMIKSIPILVSDKVSKKELDSIVNQSLPNFIIFSLKCKNKYKTDTITFEGFNLKKTSYAHDNTIKHDGVMLHTSGTSGNIKIVFLSDTNLIAGAAQTKINRSVTSNDVLYFILPVTFVYGLVLSLGIFYSNAALFVSEKFKVSHLKNFNKHKISMLSYTPRGLFRLVSIMKEKNMLFRYIRYIAYGGDALSLQDKQMIEDFFNLPLVNGYGMTEATSTVSVNNGDRNGVGKVIPSLEIKFLKNGIFNDQEGTIHLKGNTIASGYYEPFNGILKFSEDGWLNTYDYGYISGTDLILLGREKDLIITTDNLYFPGDIEAFIKLKTNISVIVGQKNNSLMLFTKFITLDELNRITALINEYYNISSIKHIIIKKIPMSYNGKIKRQELLNGVN